MQTQAERENRLVLSYLALRKSLGALGMSLPVLLGIGGWVIFSTGIQSSVSAYYYTDMGDIFVGALCAIGFFLYSYRGYEAIDNAVGNLAGISAVCVGIFPTFSTGDGMELSGYIHLIFSALLFLSLAYFCLLLFTKTNPDEEPTSAKHRRNKVYVACGWTILISIGLIAVHSFVQGPVREALDQLNPRFWLEAIAIFAFGVSWLVKGEAILKDENEGADNRTG